jgi:hypothetical protein
MTPAPNAGAAPGRDPSGCGIVGAGTSVLGWVFLALLGAARARRRSVVKTVALTLGIRTTDAK